eukprot:jgi/Mesen1/8016/ME000426S07175
MASLVSQSKAYHVAFDIAAACSGQAEPLVRRGGQRYELPTWAKFEMGQYPVFWETANGRAPASGEVLTVWFNPSSSSLTPNPEYGIGFNGGFNSPIMCGGEPRQMTRKDRGPQCAPFYTIKINVPVFAMNIQFSFTDGDQWAGPYTLDLEIPAKWRNMPASFFNERLAGELAADGACDSAIFPDAAYIQDRCIMPGGLSHVQGASCELDFVPGCTDPESPFYDPFANVDDGSCPLDPDML